MQVLEYSDLDTTAVSPAYRKIVAAIERDDFRSADIKKLTHSTHAKLYRAKLDYANRLLLTFVRHANTTYAVALEVIEQHAYEKSRFLRGAQSPGGKPRQQLQDYAACSLGNPPSACI